MSAAGLRAEAPPPLEAEAVVVRLGGVEIVRGVSLSVAKGEVLGILGPSGAGKSTLFRALVGEQIADRGVVRLGGVDVSHEPLWRRARRRLGYVPQTPSVLLDLSVRDNLDTFERIAGGRAPRGAEQWAAEVDLSSRLGVRAGDLSGGERRRLEIGRALIPRPEVLVCDEPFAGIDPTGSDRIGELLRRQAQSGVAIVLADHHVEEALRLCHRASLLLDGRIEITADPEVFRADPLVRRRYLAGA